MAPAQPDLASGPRSNPPASYHRAADAEMRESATEGSSWPDPAEKSCGGAGRAAGGESSNGAGGGGSGGSAGSANAGFGTGAAAPTEGIGARPGRLKAGRGARSGRGAVPTVPGMLPAALVGVTAFALALAPPPKASRARGERSQGCGGCAPRVPAWSNEPAGFGAGGAVVVTKPNCRSCAGVSTLRASARSRLTS